MKSRTEIEALLGNENEVYDVIVAGGGPAGIGAAGAGAARPRCLCASWKARGRMRTVKGR